MNLDKFYTKKEVSKTLYNKIPFDLDNYFLIEPSAGDGAFSELFHENSIALDIQPDKENILKMDFFNLELNNTDKKMYIGNPPFGKNTSLAIKFFNKASKDADVICFVVPKTFRKNSVKNKLDLNFHLLQEIEIDENSFIHNGNNYSVPCVFQIWKKESKKREIIKQKLTTNLFDFVSKEEADFGIKRTGVRAGVVLDDIEKYSANANYFIKADNHTKEVIRKSFKELSLMAHNTAGIPSISKGELIEIVEKKYKEEPTKEVQHHGFAFEEQVKRNFSLYLDDKDINYGSHWDIPPVSIKSFKNETKNNIVYFGSIERMFKNQGFLLVLIGYKQVDNFKVPNYSDFVYITDKQMKLLQGSLTLTDIEMLNEKLRSFVDYKEARIWAKEAKKEYNNKTIFDINFKIDSKKQRRIQCSLSIEKLHKALDLELIKLNSLDIKKIQSSKRKIK